MNSSYILLIVSVIALIVIAVLSKLLKTTNKLPYQKKQYLLTIPERTFFDVLQNILGNSYHIFPQVNLDKIVHVEKGTGKYQLYYHRINQYSVDFIICDKSNLTPVLAIELDDSSHLLSKRQDRDDFVNQVFADAGLAILRVPVKQTYDTQSLTVQIQEKLSAHI